MPQNFSGQNLRGRSFKGQDLTGANFSYADILSTDFTGTNLRGANFSYATAGLQKRWAIFLVGVSWLLSGVLGFLSAITGALIAYIADTSSRGNQVLGWIVLIIVIVVFIVILLKGLNSAVAFTGGFAVAVAVAIAIAVAVAFAFAFAGVFAIAGAGAFARTVGIGIAAAIAVAIAVAGAFAVGIAFAVVFAGVFAVAFAVAGAIAGAIAIAVAFAGAIAGAIAVAVAFAVGGSVALFSAYIAWKAMKGDEKYSLIRNMAVAFAAFGGTSFRNADLTDANFTSATLKSTDFREANLTRTCFHKTKKLDRVRPGTTYLQEPQLRQVLVTLQGQDKNFDREDLRGVNFQGVNLVDASFISADLSQANLQDADLSRAKLVQAQLNGTDLTGTTLTGAYIQDWGITTDTKFDGVRCEYVYMRLPTKEKPDPLRKPDNNKEVFADGEFGDFIQPIFDTLDLYHNQSIDPRAIAISFKQLAENHPDAELEIVAMEKRGQDKFLLRAKTAAMADKSQLSAEYFDTYNEIKSLPEREVKLLLAEKDSRIRSLENFVTQALQRPSYYSNVEQVATMTNNQGGFSVGGSVGGNVNNVQGDNNQQRVSNKSSNFNLQGAQFAGGLVNAETVTAHQIGGNITNYTTEQEQNLTLAATEIKQILQQLEKTNSITTSADKLAVVTRAVDEIEKNPTLKVWIIEALLSSQREALKEAIEHPLVNILMASIDEWQNERDSLEQAYTLQSQKIASIRNAWVIETDPSRKFQYEQQLQSEERILKKLDDRLNAIEKQL